MIFSYNICHISTHSQNICSIRQKKKIKPNTSLQAETLFGEKTLELCFSASVDSQPVAIFAVATSAAHPSSLRWYIHFQF